MQKVISSNADAIRRNMTDLSGDTAFGKMKFEQMILQQMRHRVPFSEQSLSSMNDNQLRTIMMKYGVKYGFELLNTVQERTKYLHNLAETKHTSQMKDTILKQQSELGFDAVDSSSSTATNIESENDIEISNNNIFDSNGNLLPNNNYQSGEHEYNYQTDQSGRIENVTTPQLQLTNRTKRAKHNPNSPDKQSGDHAGHLIADRFGGSPELDNIVSMAEKVNLSLYKRIENQWTRAIKSNKNVAFDMEIQYDTDSKRPDRFIIEYTIDGKPYRNTIENKE